MAIRVATANSKSNKQSTSIIPMGDLHRMKQYAMST